MASVAASPQVRFPSDEKRSLPVVFKASSADIIVLGQSAYTQTT
jgi:hypothetical protein